MRPGAWRPRLANGLWVALCRPGHARFVSALQDPARVQTARLLSLVRRNADTDFGAVHDFGAVSSVADYQRRVPVSSYEQYLPAIEQIAAGRPRVLTAGPVRLFEPTSGSAAAEKLIPYTSALRDEFQAGIAPWVRALYTRQPELMRGTAYWSISPRVGAPGRRGAVPVGFEEDADYLGGAARRLFELTRAVPASVADEQEAGTFQERTLLHLLAARELRLISVWSPSFLTVLLRRFLDAPSACLDALAASGLPGARERAARVAAWLSLPPGELFARVWPDLNVVSCWTHGASAQQLPELGRLLPHVAVQGKGLIATEAFVSLPFLPDADPVLAVTSHFFEFRDVLSGEVVTAERVEKGRSYAVIVTTGGGLYRYDLRDVVEVTGCAGRTPTLRFLGRDDTSDRFGEKLNAAYADTEVLTILKARRLAAEFVLLAPDTRPAGAVGYTLFLHCDDATEGELRQVASDLEDALRRSFHYDLCRSLGQLGEARVFRLRMAPGAAARAYQQRLAGQGRKLGGIKPAILTAVEGWREHLSGEYVAG